LKARLSAYVDEELKDWLIGKVREGRFRSIAHGVEESLIKMKAELERGSRAELYRPT